MQGFKIFKYLSYFFRFALVICFGIAVLQNYFSTDGTIYLFGIKFTQFYPHVENRTFPLLWVSFFLVPTIQRVLKIEGKFYFSRVLIDALVFVDAFTHINGFYSSSIELVFYERIWFDKEMHFASGVVLLSSLSPLMMRFILKDTQIKSFRIASYFITIGFISIFLILWEIVELLIDRNLKTRLITGPHDTNEDLMFTYLGFVVAVIISEVYALFYRKMRTVSN